MRGTRVLGIAILAAGLIIPTTSCAQTAVSISSAATTASPRAIPSPPPLPKRPPERSAAQIAEGIVITESQKLGAALTPREWQDLSAFICRDLNAGGPGLYTPNAAKSLPAKTQSQLASLYLDGATEGTCSAKKRPSQTGDYYGSDIGRTVAYALYAEPLSTDRKYQTLLTQYIKDVRAYGRTYGVDVSRLLAAVPGGSGSSGGSGYDVVCADGWVSSSGGKQGACSHHGGVG